MVTQDFYRKKMCIRDRYYDGDNIVGIDADIAKAICDKLGYELQIEDMEFDSIIAAVQSGKEMCIRDRHKAESILFRCTKIRKSKSA